MHICFAWLKAKASKKRPLESAQKTPVPEKKAKLVTPENTGELFFIF